MSRKASLSDAEARVFEGLSALEGLVKGEQVGGLDITTVPVEDLLPSPYQPRKTFGKKKLEELADSIRQEGVLQPILVRPIAGGKYEIVAGERRWRAAQLAGLEEVPCVVREVGEEQARVISLIENLHREDLNDVERGQGLRELREITGASWEEVGKRVGLSRRSVLRLAGLTELPDHLRGMLIEHDLTEKHGRALKRLADKPHRQKQLAQAIAKYNLTGDEALAAAQEAKEHPRMAFKNIVERVRWERGASPGRGIEPVLRAAQNLSKALQKAQVGPMRESKYQELQQSLEEVEKLIADFRRRLGMLKNEMRLWVLGSKKK